MSTLIHIVIYKMPKLGHMEQTKSNVQKGKYLSTFVFCCKGAAVTSVGKGNPIPTARPPPGAAVPIVDRSIRWLCQDFQTLPWGKGIPRAQGPQWVSFSYFAGTDWRGSVLTECKVDSRIWWKKAGLCRANPLLSPLDPTLVSPFPKLLTTGQTSR